jgi:hypothetical protein
MLNNTMLKVPCADLSVPRVQYGNGEAIRQKETESTWGLTDVQLRDHYPATPFNIFILVHESNLRGRKTHPQHDPSNMPYSCRTVARYKWELEAVMRTKRGACGVGKIAWKGEHHAICPTWIPLASSRGWI